MSVRVQQSRWQVGLCRLALRHKSAKYVVSCSAGPFRRDTLALKAFRAEDAHREPG